MKKNKLYLFTFITISIIVFVIGYFNMNYLIKVSTNQLLEIQIESSKREAREFSSLVGFQIENGTDRSTVIKNIQESIEGTNTESGFICMFDWSGVEICHPDPQKIGKQVNPNESFVRNINDGINSEDFYELLTSKSTTGGLREFNSNRNSEIIYLYPVKNTDWIIAAHANIDKIEEEVDGLRLTFLFVYLLTCLSIIFLSVLTVRYLTNYYENELELKNQQLKGEVITLSKLNEQLTTYKNKVQNKIEDEQQLNDSSGKLKKRVLTHLKDKLVTIKTEQISFIHTENTVTYITCLNGDIFPSNSSLEDLFQGLDQSVFFRANRQYIISIKGVEEIFKYGNNQLKITTKHGAAIIISKNKAAEFKKWLNA